MKHTALRWELLEGQIVASKCTNTRREVHPLAFVPLRRYFLAGSHEAPPFQAKGRKVPKDQELV